VDRLHLRLLRHLLLLLLREEQGVLHQGVGILERARKLVEELHGLGLQVRGGWIQTSQGVQLLKAGWWWGFG
jgi:hypothetical protein